MYTKVRHFLLFPILVLQNIKIGTSFFRCTEPTSLKLKKLPTPNHSRNIISKQLGLSLLLYLPPTGVGSVEIEPKVQYGFHFEIGKSKKFLTLTGIMFFVSTFFFKLLTFPFECLAYCWSKLFDRKRRRLVDLGISIWMWLSMKSMFYAPKIEGLKNLPPDEEGVLYLANHSSFLDIFSLSAFIPRGFKYVSKLEILQVPLIGWSMQMAGHIPLVREDPMSQLDVVKKTIHALQDGNSVCMFPEGTRTLDGLLGEFKRGPFVIARKAGVRIVPISICHAHRWFPYTALMPLATPTDIILKIHPPIDSKGLTDAELLKKTFEAIESSMPPSQRRGLVKA